MAPYEIFHEYSQFAGCAILTNVLISLYCHHICTTCKTQMVAKQTLKNIEIVDLCFV